MNERLCGLIRRLASPPVAVRLVKEELCLSMSAIARLHLRRDQLASLPSIDVMATRAQRISRLCTATELGMIAEGAEALCCKRFDLADALNNEMYGLVCKRGSSTCISHVSAIIRYSDTISGYSNETSVALLKAGASLLQTNDSQCVLKLFLGLAQRHLSNEEFRALLEEFRAKATAEQRDCIDNVATLSLGEGNPFSCGEIAVKYVEEGEGTDCEDKETSTWNVLRARRWMSRWIRCGSPPTPTDAVQAMELYVHFGVRDAVLQEKIEELVISTIPTATSFHLDEMHKVVLKSHNLFPRVREVVCESRGKSSGVSSDGAEALLTTTCATSRAYNLLLEGQRISEDMMFDVLREQNEVTSVDVTAQAACLFVERGDIPETVILRLTVEVEGITSQGFPALVRAARRDSSGVLLSRCRTAFNRFAKMELRDMAVETLLQLCEALATPTPRGEVMRENTSEDECQSNLQKALIARFFTLIQGSQDVPFLCRVAKAVRAFDRDDELVQFVCSVVCARGLLTEWEAVTLLDMIQCRDFVHEPLLDVMEPVFRRLVESVCAMLEGKVKVKDAELQQVVRFAAIQSEFGCPDFESCASLLVHVVEENIGNVPAELLPSVGLLCVREKRGGTLRAIAERLRGNVQHQLSDEAICQLGRLLMDAESVATKELAVELHAAVISRLMHQQLLSPDVVARSVVVYLQQGDEAAPIDTLIVEYILKWMYALSSEVYTKLCQVVHLAGPQESLSNALIEDLPRRLELLTPSELANAVFGLGEVSDMGERLSHQLVTERCSDYVVDHSHEFWSGKDMARLLYGFSRMHCTKRSLYNVFATRLARRPVFSLLDQEAISLAIGAFGRAKYLDKKLFDRLTRWMLDHSKDLSAAELLLTIRGASRVMLLNDQLYSDLGLKAAEKVREFPIESQCVLLSSFGSLGIEHERLANQMATSIAENREELTDATKAVDVITSLWLMNYDVEDDKNVAQLADWVVERAGELTEEAIGKLCLVLADTHWRHVPLVRAIAEQSVQLQKRQNISPKCCREVLDMLGTFMIHHQGARENLSVLGRSVSKERVQLSEEEEEQLHLLLRP